MQLYIPDGLSPTAFQTLHDDTRVNYLISEFHVPGAADGIRYNEPGFRREVAATGNRDFGKGSGLA